MGFLRQPEWFFLSSPSSQSSQVSPSSETPEAVSTVKTQKSKLSAKQIQALMWKSIQAQDVEELKQAIALGADVNEEKRKNAAIVTAFQLNDVEMARVLMDAKPNLDVFSSGGETLFRLASNHNSIELADLLREHDPHLATFKNMRTLESNALLTQWWLDKKLPLKFELAPGEQAYWYGHQTLDKNDPLWMRFWACMAFQHWNKGFLDQLADGLLEVDPRLQNKDTWQRCLVVEFFEVFEKRRVDILQTMAEHNWMPGLKCVNLSWMAEWSVKDKAPHEMVSLFWLAAHKQDVEGMTYLLQSPELFQQAKEEANTLKEKLYGVLGVHVPTLEVVVKTGLPLFEVVDFTHVFQDDYRQKKTPFEEHLSGTYLHAKSWNMTKALLEWTSKVQPSALWEADGMGNTILDILNTSNRRRGFDPSALGEGFLKKQLKKNLDKAAPESKGKPLKKRL